MAKYERSGLRRWLGSLPQAEEVRRTHGLSVTRQLAQIAYFWHRIGTKREEYYMYELYDVRRPLAERLSYLSIDRWERIIDRLNPQSGHALADNKTVFSALMQQAGLRTAPVLGVFDAQCGYASGGGALREAADLRRLLARGFPAGLVVKDEGGKQGVGVHVFPTVIGDRLERIDGRWFTCEELERELIGSSRRFVVQERVVCHPALQPLAGRTLLTFRLGTFLRDDGQPVIVGASARIPVQDEGVDNFSAGNLAAEVSLSTGRLGRACRRAGSERFDVHPNGTRIEGIEVPMWTEACDLVKRAAVVMSALPTVGWDVAIAPDGPVVMEANTHWRFIVLQRPSRRGLWQGEFREWCERRSRAAAS